MIGAILGDIAGSRYEFSGSKVEPQELWTDLDFFTDDTVLTCATAWAILSIDIKSMSSKELQMTYIIYIRDLVKGAYPDCTWGAKFLDWVNSLPPLKYDDIKDTSILRRIKFNDSFGNGCAMKISPVAYVSESLEEVKRLSKVLTQVTHNTPEGIKYAEAVATTTYIAIHTRDKQKVIDNILLYCPEVADFKSYKDLQSTYSYTELAKDTVPQALYCFIVSKNFEDAIRKAIGLGGDADTLAAITGSVAEAFYKYESHIEYRKTVSRLRDRYLNVPWDEGGDPSVLEKITRNFIATYEPKLY